MPERLEKLKSLLGRYQASALFISHLPNIRWATGFSGSNGLLVVTEKNYTLVTDSRYTERARREVTAAEVRITRQRPVGYLAAEKLLPDGRVIFQSDHLTVSQAEKLAEPFPGIDWQGKERLLDELVAPKSPEELASIRRAQAITDAVFEEILPLLKPGITEKEVAAEIIYRQLRQGASSMPVGFNPLVASGPNSALPHAHATDRRLAANEPVLLDFGCVVDDYCSDMTRTVTIGDPGEKFREVYDVVLRAQEAAISAAKPGMPGSELDAAARALITKAGYSENFPYSLGHGVGLEIHEYPYIRTPVPAIRVPYRMVPF